MAQRKNNLPNLISNYLLSLGTVTANTIVLYLNRELPSINVYISDKGIIIIWVISVVALSTFTFLVNNLQQNSTTSNENSQFQVNSQSNWIGGFLLFLMGAVIYALLQLNIIPEESTIPFGYISLILCGFGAIVPSFLLIPKYWQNILLWLFSGIGVFLTFHYFIVANLNAAFISFIFTLISVILLAGRDFLVEVIRNVSEFWGDEQNRQASKISELIINKLKDLFSKVEDLFSPFKRDYYKALEYKCRDDETQGLDNEFTLELQKVFVPLKIAANYSDNIKQDIITELQNQSSSETTIWDFLAAKNDKRISLYKILVILGRPGSGKTTLLRHLTLIYVTKQQQNINRKAPKLIPVLFYMREIRNEIIKNQSLSLETLIQQQIEKLKINGQSLNPPSNWVERNLKQNKFIIMLDGLDEVADEEQRGKVRDWVDNQMRSYQNMVFVLTSRPNGYATARLQISSKQVLEVQPFNREQITDFLQRWYVQTEIKSRGGQCDGGVKDAAEQQANNLIERIVNSPPLIAMAVNPLLLKMIATVHRRGNVLPGKRVELYKDICQILLEKRQQAKKIPDGLTAGQQQSILQVLALKLMQNERREFTLEQAENWISGQLSTLPKLNKAKDFITKILDVYSLLVGDKEAEEYEFAHLSFQEYLAAVEISESNQEHILINNIDKTWWSETISLYAAQAKNATNIVNAVINKPSPSINAFLVIADYEEEGWRIDKQVREELVSKLDAGLESDDEEIFKLAAEVKLARRLRNFTRVDENIEINKDYNITCAEYKLFLLETGYDKIPQDWQNQSFPKGTAKNKVDGITIEDANQFCCWLSLRDLTNQLDEQLTWYRLPTPKELHEYRMGETNFDNKTGISLVRCKLPLKYKQLAEYLMRGEWKKADEETLTVMLRVANRETESYLDEEAIDNFPCEDLGIIDRFWVSTSNGKFGFSVQKDIYQSLGGKRLYNERVFNNFGDRVAWRRGGRWLEYKDYTFNLSAQSGNLPCRAVCTVTSSTTTFNCFAVLFSRAETCKL
ncbi:GUN4 domain-containing protein [Mastigocoleus sp. MO_188.B34]|uniref:GUN4 domain-containing protein n=1 Tax=Mastigocoleus sp. MO_188.B34 TaxID=3036635 RepID=UPI002605B22F|nr:GUN4 domain-containing protein [Mastigocoleus sp. MO_188.B34]MDJ0694512.1 GUN4 domain-containing protein [Mastigocoleus sp. MO_188.B34]